jgi:hypothetical protein
MEVDQKTCRLDRIKQENLKYGTTTKAKVINNHIDFNKARTCPCADIMSENGEILQLDLACPWRKQSKTNAQKELDRERQELSDMENLTCRHEKKATNKKTIDPDDKYLRQCPCDPIIIEDGSSLEVDMICPWLKISKKRQQEYLDKKQEKLLQLSDLICRRDRKDKPDKIQTACPCTDIFDGITNTWKYMGDIWCTWSDSYKDAMIKANRDRKLYIVDPIVQCHYEYPERRYQCPCKNPNSTFNKINEDGSCPHSDASQLKAQQEIEKHEEEILLRQNKECNRDKVRKLFKNNLELK